MTNSFIFQLLNRDIFKKLVIIIEKAIGIFEF